MKRIIHYALAVAACASLFTGILPAADTIQFAIKNVGPEGGLWIMRPWIGLHDGNFTTYSIGQTASSGVRHIAEDGITGDPNSALLSGPGNGCPAMDCMYHLFGFYANGSQQASIGGPTAPGATLIKNFTVDPTDPKSQYLSFLVMIVPSNDAFFGTDSQQPIRLYDDKGRFNGGRGPIRLLVLFKDILDAGTEVNTESPSDTAFLGQSVAGTGTHPDTNPLIRRHDPFGSNIVNGHNFYPASQWNVFNRANYFGPIAEVTISKVE